MGKRGQTKKSCTHCIRRKVRCDLIDKKQEGKQKCTACQRRKQECIEAKQILMSNNDDNSIVLDTTKTIPSIEPISKDLPDQIHDNPGIKGLDSQQIKDAFFAFYSSNCFLSRILIYWKPKLEPLLSSISSMDPMEPICVLLEAIVSHGLTLDPIKSISSLPSKTIMVYHLRSSLESILTGKINNLNSLKIEQLNAILASCTILLDLWPDIEIFYPKSILPNSIKEKPIESINLLNIPIDHEENSSRLLEYILFEKRGFSIDKENEIGNCFHSILLYWYIILIDSFSESFPERRPFVNSDTVTFLEKYIEQKDENIYIFSKNSPSMNQIEIDSRNQTANLLFNLGELAKISRKISSIRKLSLAFPNSIEKEDFNQIINQLNSWKDSKQGTLVQSIKDQKEPLGYCIHFLYKYCYLRVHGIVRNCKIFDRIEEDDKVFSQNIRSASLSAWKSIVNMMEELEKARIEDGTRHILLSQSRLMIYSILDCIYWGLQKLLVEGKNIEKFEWREIKNGSDKMLSILNSYSEEDVCLGLDVLDFMSRLGQFAYKVELKANE